MRNNIHLTITKSFRIFILANVWFTIIQMQYLKSHAYYCHGSELFEFEYYCNIFETSITEYLHFCSSLCTEYILLTIITKGDPWKDNVIVQNIRNDNKLQID